MNRNKETSKKYGQNKSGKYSKKPQSKKISSHPSDEEAVVSEKEGRSMYNDPNWYFTDAVVADQASQLSFNQFLGASDSGIQDYEMATIMTIHLNPSPFPTYPNAADVDISKKSGFNMAMTKLFNKLSMKSGRNMAYAPQDVGMSILAEGELLSMISYAKRIFGLAQTYNMRNRQFPKQMIKALGIDPDDLFQNYANYRMRFNTLLASVNQIPILTNSGYLRKCLTLYDNIFVDSDNSMAQVYAYVPESTWIIDETSQQTGTKLTTTPVVFKQGWDNTLPTIRTFADFMQSILEPMVSALLESSTLNLVYADLLNLATFENWTFFKFEPISDSYTVMPVYDLMTLKQIHNMVLLTQPTCPANGSHYTMNNDVISDPAVNGIKYAPAFELNVVAGPEAETNGNGWPVIIDTDNSAPEMKERIELTRYIAAYGFRHETISQKNYVMSSVVPDHYATYAMIYTKSVDANHAIAIWTYMSTARLTPALLAAVSKFDWHPMIQQFTEPSSGYSKISSVIGDMGYYTTVDALYLRRLNQIVAMGLFEIRNDFK